MTSSANAEPKGSEPSSSEPKKCGYSEHPFKPYQGFKDEPGKPHCLTCGHVEGGCDEHPECQHPNKQYTGAVYDGPAGRKTFLYYTCPDCKAKLKEEEKRCKDCGHTEGEGCGCPPQALPEPPLTPEEEEQAPCPHESWDVIGEWGEKDASGEVTGKWWKSRRCNDCGEGLDNVLEDEPHWDLQPAPPPPQPDRRPPYAVAYSVQGHLYEVALPGDATVQAVDGALVIRHHLGPVAGITQVLPVINKESA